MQPPDRVLLTTGAAALGVDLNAERAELLCSYLDLLSKWNRVYNLTAVRGPSEMVVQHLLDSLTVVQPLRRWLRGKPARALDVGSGAGLPGVVVAALLPEVDVTSVDAVGKKASFVRQAAGQLMLTNLHAIHGRVESLPDGAFDVIISRAFSSLTDFVDLSWRHRTTRSVWLAMKGKHPAQEISALRDDVEVFHVEQLRVPGLNAERCLIWMRARP